MISVRKSRVFVSVACAIITLGSGYTLWSVRVDSRVHVSAPKNISAEQRTSTVSNVRVDHAPSVMEARVEVGGQFHVIAANAQGEYPRVFVSGGEAIHVTMMIANAEAGETLWIGAEDGGELLGSSNAGELLVGERGRADFSFRAAASDGMQRVTVRRGSEIKRFEFWVGAEAPVIARK